MWNPKFSVRIQENQIKPRRKSTTHNHSFIRKAGKRAPKSSSTLFMGMHYLRSPATPQDPFYRKGGGSSRRKTISRKAFPQSTSFHLETEKGPHGRRYTGRTLGRRVGAGSGASDRHGPSCAAARLGVPGRAPPQGTWSGAPRELPVEAASPAVTTAAAPLSTAS